MRETLFFDIKPISLNLCHRAIYRPKKGGKGYASSIKSESYRIFERQFAGQLNMQLEKVKKIAGFYEHGVNFFTMGYVFKFPRSEYFTKAGPIAKRCADVDNLIKPVNDQLFKSLAIYQPGIDDSSIVAIKALKLPSETEQHKIIIDIHLRETLDNTSIY